MGISDPIKAAYKSGKRAKNTLRMREARHLGHPHDLANGMDLHRHPLPDSGKTRTPRPSQITRHHDRMVERNLLALSEHLPNVGNEAAIYEEQVREGKRPQYAALAAHKELAAQVLSCGGTFEEAGDWAGVTASTVARYWEDADLRARVLEYKAILKSVIGGRLLGSLDRLTNDDERLDALSVRDRLALYDRFESGPERSGTGAGPAIGQQTNILAVGYQDFMEKLAGTTRQPSGEATLDVDDAGAEGRGFPVVGVDRPPVAG